MKELKTQIFGITALLLNNPQTVDRFNPYAKAMAKINAKKTRRTDDDYLKLRDLEIRSKIYWDDELGIYVPFSWVLAALAKHSFHVCKVSKANIRGAVVLAEGQEERIKLSYDKMELVKTPEDIVGNDHFRHLMLLPQGQVRVAKEFPIFHKWSFETNLEYDPSIIDPDGIEETLVHAAKYGGFGDFRPSFGRAKAVVSHV